MDNNALAYEYVKKNGPVQPSQISTTINTNILFASAILSELVSNKKIKLTYLKRGGSPFYYVDGQEEKLMNLAQYLSGKVKEAYELISDKLVIRDKTALPWQRVALRELKDFVVPLTVNYQDEQEIFWKWYLTSNDEAKSIVKNLLEGDSMQKEEIEPSNEIESANDKGIENIENNVNDFKKEVSRETSEERKEEIKPLEEDYLQKSLAYFEKLEMYIISQVIVRKGREFNFVVDVPSNLGKLRYFVKFKNKKIITENDLLSALEEANKNNLPVLFLSNGDLNKKAQKYLDDNASGILVYFKLD